ncbi:molybdate ABC transporter substrate-binding protein [Hoeflea prorocentri]|uniref:Molybdate-binding protein ModA n=1 Tax=Hoeflea prorocentri TaxID=1922333 RepID=A0A9X3UEF0_9HYPH|nr:molybdate ABC transporter substrate-binding protein [Hoeflea prorocentri]MCY6379180.1 molybdate ABC transporter substrate-binding protein [Hoeflea prorocentri]MDA5396981.1 molybdate ABC transporter substrate-binding protein [Hoeflea prorocentri]
MLWRLTVAIMALCATLASVQASERTLVFAAASMKDAVEAVARAYEAETGNAVAVSFAGSGALARQIEAGAPADLYLAANAEWMDYLEARELIDAESRLDVAGNELVAVARSDGSNKTKTGAPDVLRTGRFAMGDPSHVPAGIYARQALETLQLWNELQSLAAFGENVRIALALAARGDVAFALVYRSDAAMRDDVDVVYRFSGDLHAPIVYPLALTADANAGAQAFYDYFTLQAESGALEPFGFTKPATVGKGS